MIWPKERSANKALVTIWLMNYRIECNVNQYPNQLLLKKKNIYFWIDSNDKNGNRIAIE